MNRWPPSPNEAGGPIVALAGESAGEENVSNRSALPARLVTHRLDRPHAPGHAGDR